MQSNKIGLAAGLGLATSLLLTIAAQAQSAAALSGQVSSTQEPVMEGVLVTAKKDGSTISTTVVTDDKGQFSFPAARLEPGKYTIAIRAIGYVLDGPKSIEVPAGGSKLVRLRLSAKPPADAPAILCVVCTLANVTPAPSAHNRCETQHT